MQTPLCLYFLVFTTTTLLSQTCYVLSNSAPGDKVNIITASSYSTPPPMPTATNAATSGGGSSAASAQQKQERDAAHLLQHQHAAAGGAAHVAYHAPAASAHLEHRNSYNLLSEAMSQAVTNEFSGTFGSGSADGACAADDLDCYGGSVQDRLGMEAIRTLHRQLDDDDNGNIDLSESDDFLREELKYDSGYEKRQKVFHFNDDMHISVKELWEAWLRSEVHNWTIEQTTDWLAQSVQLPQYVDLFRLHKVTGAALPRLAVNNMHYVSNVLGIKDPIHKQKIALKAMDVVLFGPPRETGTRWKDYILVTLLLSAIIGCWYAYQQNKNAKRHLRRMAQDMEGLQRAEQSLQEMQKELERARLEQENVATEKQDLERRLKEAPTITASSSDLEVQQLKKEIEILRSELSRAEIELVDNCWSPPPQLQSWLQYTYELENKNHMKKRISAEKQLQLARESCEKLRKKRTSFVGAFVSTHGKSIDDVDRSIVEARNALGEVTNELQERLHRWKQIEQCLGLNIVNNNGLAYLESVLYGGRNGIASKTSRGRITNSTDDLDDESVQGILDSYGRSSIAHGSSSTILNSSSNALRCDDSSGSEDGTLDNQSQVHFYLGAAPTTPATPAAIATASRSFMPLEHMNHHHSTSIITPTPTLAIGNAATAASVAHMHNHVQSQQQQCNFNANSQMLRSQSTDFVPMESYHYCNNNHSQSGNSNASMKTAALASKAAMMLAAGHNRANALNDTICAERKKMIKQHSSASQQSTSSNSSSVHSTPANTDADKAHMLGKWLSQDVIAQQARQRRDNFLNLETTPTPSVSQATNSTASSIAATSLDSLPLADDTSSVGSDSLKKRKRRFRLSFVSKKLGGSSSSNSKKT